MKSTIDDVFVQQCYPKLIAFARVQLMDEVRAEDVVQETLIAAMQHSEKFAARAAFETWVFAILKNKIIDEFRRNQKTIVASELADSDDALLLATFFDTAGSWQEDNQPKPFDDSWCVNDDSETQAFWQVLELCLSRLPAEQARVFLMKEYMELDTEEICQTCAISSQNFYVLMHRARLRLQQCLRLNWFDDSSD